MTAAFTFNSEVFSCEQRDRVAVLRLKQGAFDLLTNLDARADYFEVTSRIEESSDVLGLLILNSEEYPGNDKYRQFMQKIVDADKRGIEGRRFLLSLKENSLALLSLHVASFKKLLVAGFQGPVTAAFFGFSLGADFRIVSDDTTFDFPLAALGFPLGGAIGLYLPRFVGQQRAIEILFAGEPISASQALEFGLVNQVVSKNEIEDRCIECIEKYAMLPQHAIAATRALLHPDAVELRQYLDRSFDTMQEALAQLNRRHASQARLG